MPKNIYEQETGDEYDFDFSPPEDSSSEEPEDLDAEEAEPDEDPEEDDEEELEFNPDDHDVWGRLAVAIAGQMSYDLGDPDELKEFFGTMKDVLRGGADAGFSGFIYTTECVEFYDANEGDIMEMAENEAEGLGYPSVMAMATEFVRADMLGMGIDGYKNLMAWYALEQVAGYLEANIEGEW